MEFLPGCSWYCGGKVAKMESSSYLQSTAGLNYGPKNAHDFNKNTAWVEGKPGYGIGEYLEYHFRFDSTYQGTLGINKIILANGYKKSFSTWSNNARVKQLKMYLNDKEFAIINLLDSYEIQTIDFDTILFPANKTTRIRFEITEIYEGKRYKDTAISLLMFDGVGVH